MSNNEFTDAQVREYLLGQATPDAAERLDELSFTDEFAERLGAAERDLIDEYLAGELPPAKKHLFEAYYLASPIRWEKMEFARAFASYAKRSAPASAGEPVSGGSILDGFRNLRAALQFGLAAAGLLLAAVFGWLIYQSSAPTSGSGAIIATDLGSQAPTSASITATPALEPVATSSPAIVPSPSIPNVSNATPAPTQLGSLPIPPRPNRPQPRPAIFTLTPALRGSTFQAVKLPAGPAEIRLRLETDSNGPLTAEIVELRGQAKIWTARGLAVSGRGVDRTLNFRIPAGTLGPGEHRVTIFAGGGGGQQEKVGDYFFRVAP